VRIGIVGNEAAKFTAETERKAKEVIRTLLSQPNVTAMVSGGCHLGGIDIWAEEIANEMGIKPVIYLPHILAWPGYRKRNLLIAGDSDIVHNIVVATYPPEFSGMRFRGCYHCSDLRLPHVKSGGCWTAMKAKKAEWHIIYQGDPDAHDA